LTLSILDELGAIARSHRIPYHALLELTYGCNLRCVMCYNPTHKAQGELTLDEYEVLFDQLARAGTVQLTLTGGEVLARRDFWDIAQAARDRHFALRIFTNGTRVTPEIARRFADLESGAMPNGIAFDHAGGFGHRLLVTAAVSNGTAVFALDCTGSVSTITPHAPRLEGGIEVAPASFGRYAGDLIAPDEYSGRLLAIDPQGAVHTVARSGLPSGADIGVESAGFVPPQFDRSQAAYLADRRSPGNPHPGTDSILRISGADLVRAGVRPGDLLVASEGGAKTIAVRCGRTCSVRKIADGPATSHAEGHIVVAPAP
jgi:hypothetical protein